MEGTFIYNCQSILGGGLDIFFCVTVEPPPILGKMMLYSASIFSSGLKPPTRVYDTTGNREEDKDISCSE